MVGAERDCGRDGWGVLHDAVGFAGASFKENVQDGWMDLFEINIMEFNGSEEFSVGCI